MKKIMGKRIIALLTVCILLVCSLCGCGDKGDIGTDLTVMFKLSENNGSDTTIVDTFMEMAGVNATYIKAPSASYTEKLNSVLASGNLPDIVYMDETNMNSWIEEGALLPLDDLLEEYAPNFLNTITDDDMKELIYAGDGHLYGLPYILRLPVQSTMGVRRDWMEKLGLEDPKTIEELENVLTKFKENASILNPGGSVIPMAGPLDAFYMMFGIQRAGENNVWTLDEDGNYISIYEHPNYEECITTLNRFYEKGLIDPEYMTRNSNNDEMYALFNSGVAGMGFVYSTRLREITEILQETNAEAVFDYMDPVAGIDGKQRIPGRNIFGTRACVTITAEDKIVECLKLLDFAYSEKGERLFNYGIEGVHYDMVDGKPVIKDEYNHGWVEIRKQGVVPTTFAYNRSLDAYNQCMFYGKDISELDEYELLTYKAYYENEKYVVTPLRKFSVETDTTDAYAALSEKSSKVIIGSLSIEDFRQELAKIKSSSLDKITKEMQENWKRVNAD